jgi:GNAT superfamily N-acetyltransferase
MPAAVRLAFIAVEDTLPLRSVVLREGRPFTECRFAEDGEPGSFHVGAFLTTDTGGKQLVGIASWYRKDLEGESGAGWQLRGMAVAAAEQRHGVGGELLKFSEAHLRATSGVNYLWCNARVKAIGFYERHGWRAVSDAFEIAGVGPHRRMVKRILPATDKTHSKPRSSRSSSSRPR